MSGPSSRAGSSYHVAVAAVRIVGRQAEREIVGALLLGRRSVVIAGSAGVGKTRLAQEVSADARAAGLTVGWIAATQSSRDIPFGALSPLLTGVGPDGPDLEVPMTPASVLRALGASGGATEPHLPDLVVVDDGQHLDDASATALLQLVTGGKTTLVVSLTLRTTPPDAIDALWRDGSATRVDLQPLSRIETDALVTEILGGPCDTLSLERIWQTTEGNPLYVHEVLDAARAGGRLEERRGRWHIDGSGDLAGPIVDLVAARIRRLDPRVRSVLEVVALAAPVPLRVLEAVVDLDSVAAAEESGLVEVVEDRHRAVARTTHPMHAEVVRSILPRARRRSLCRQLAAAIDATGLRRRDDLLRFLNWTLAAGDTAPVDLLVRGTWQATDALDMPLAERLGRAAVACDPDNDAGRLALADAIYRQSRHDDALEVLAGSHAVGDRERTEVVVARAKSMWGLGRLAEAEAMLLETATTISDRSCLGWLQAFRANLRAALGDPRAGIALAQPIASDPSYGPRSTLSGLGALALALAFCGRAAEAVDAVRRGNHPELLATAESRTLVSWAEPALWAAAWLSGDPAEAEALAGAYRISGLDTHDAERVAAGSMGVGWANIMRGETASAVARLEDAVALAPRDDRVGIRTIALIGLGWARAWQGDVAAATSALDEAERAAAVGARWFDACATIGRGWVAATVGDEREARRLFEAAADDGERRGQRPYALFALHALARLGRAKTVSARIAALAREVDGALGPAMVAHAEALAADDPVALEACCDGFENIEMWLLAAECAAASARAHDTRGARAEGEAARTRCDTLLRRCQGARPVTLVRLRTASPLTARERQIAQLAAQGLTTRRIADQLNVSVRTVDSHLAHAYTKLAVRSRRELAAAIGDGGHTPASGAEQPD